MSGSPRDRTILEALLASIERAAVHNRNVTVAPAAVLWPDEGRQWEPLLPLLQRVCPYLLTLGSYDPDHLTGPAIWLRCLLGRQLEAAAWPVEAVPVVYLPGVGRSMLRAVESCPKHLQPLAELQYRGVFWSQLNARDWTVLAFLKSPEGGLGLDVAQDHATLEAIGRSLVQLADTPVESLQGRRLEAPDFDHLLTTDPVRDLLRWLNDPAGTRQGWGEAVWGAFRSVCKADFAFDPQAEGELAGAERLGTKAGKWAVVWARYAEAPRLYPGVPGLLAKAQPKNMDLFADRSPWPGENEKAEAELKRALVALGTKAPAMAAAELRELGKRHGMRREWVWADLGQAPLALALAHLSTVADAAEKPMGGTTPSEMGSQYAERGWTFDAAALQALACVEHGDEVEAVTEALRAVYLPWLEVSAERLQELVTSGSYPPATTVDATPGTCLLFVDGLRLDVAQRLGEVLTARGLQTSVEARWAPLPTVTATGKPDASPIAGRVAGGPADEDFTPHVAATGKPVSAHYFGKLLTEAAVQILDDDEAGDPAGTAWTEAGDLDDAGHDQGWKLARRIEEQVRELAERITGLLRAGWAAVKVVTDHGWLLMPGGLPKAQLPAYLADTRWGRCALLKPGAKPSGLVVHWRWSSEVLVALAPGVHCYREGMAYAHGGLSLQECLTPVLTVRTGAAVGTDATLGDVTWRGLRCKVVVEKATPGLRVDLRTKPADAGSSIVGGGKELSGDGRASCVVADDSLIGTAVVVVVLDANGTVVAKTPTTVGGGD